MSRILLVEDDAALRSAYEMILHKQGFQLTSVENGLEALNMIKQKKFDLILLDIMMPILDGVGFLKKANLHKLLPNVRLVVFSNL
jgi:CheY-like chemotaxis protein